jgi:hypothetical protein
MRNDKLIPGMILVLIGAIFLLHNFGYLHFHWINIFRMWPIFLVVAGVNLLFASNSSPWATILKITVIIGAFLLILFGDFDHGRYRWWPHWRYTYHSDDNNNYNDDSDDDDNGPDSAGVSKTGNSSFNEPYQAGVKVARLNISGGATTFRLNDTTSQLFTADVRSHRNKFQFDSHKEDSVYVMDFHMKNHSSWPWNDDKDNATISLNTRPEWEMHIEAGATDLNFDLSRFKVRDLTLKGGAAQFVLKMGEPLATSNISVETGASDVTINIPKDAACSVVSSSGLSSTDYPGVKKDDGHYETDNFASAKNKYYIHISGGVSDFKVHTY